MNHIYRLIWDELRCAYVAVAEIAKRRGKRAGAVVRAAAAVIAIGGLPLSVCAMDAGTLPSGAQVVSGDVQLSQQGANLTVHQDSQRAIVNWTSFDIGSQASVRFEQPDSSAVALNRVLGGSPSQILGGLSANGQVWLVNPNGVFFGKGAQVDVGGLVVSSLSISDSDFLAGRARFAATGGAGAVRNEGMIRAHGGVVAMLAPVVGNAGTITAGQVGLAAGHRVALDFSGDGMLSLAVEPDKLKAEIAQSGLIRGNNVVLSAAAASALHSSVINMDGVIEATDLGERGGHILLDGGDGGQVHVSGRLDASSAAGTGGRIDVLGDRLVLDGGAQLDASGALGGGTIHVGGGWQGKDASLRNATHVEADGSVAVKANATGKGNGGEVVLWSDDSTSFAGNIDIRGGAQGGNGGRAEVSGKQTLAYSGRTNALAARGATGDLLLDPATVTIQAGGTGTGAITGSTVYVADLEAQHANVMLQADSGMTIADLGLNGGDGYLTMANDVSLRLENKAGNIVFANANNTIEVSGTGSIYMQSGQTGTGELRNVANLVVHGSGTNPATLPTHNVSIPGNGTPGDASITLYGADGITVGGALTTHGGYVRIWGDSDNAGGGALTLDSPITTNGGNLYLSTGSGVVALNSDMRLGTGRITFRGDGTHTEGEKILNGLLDTTGDVNIDTPFTMGGNASIWASGDINFIGTVAIKLNTGDGVLVLRANKIDWGSANLVNLSTASMRLEPYDASTNMVLGDSSGFASATTLAKLPGIKNLTIGRSDGTGTITVSSDFSPDVWGNFELEDKNIEVSARLTNTTGNVTLTGDNVDITGAVTASTSTGANHAPGTAGAGKVAIRQMTAANELHLGGGLTDASIGQVNAATLEVGRTNGGNLVFDNDIATGASSVALLSGGKVLGVNGGVSANNLVVYAGGGATISDDTFDFTTLALSVGGDSEVTSSRNNWSLSNSTWNLGAVDDPISVTGLAVQPGSAATVALHAEGTLGLGSAIDFNGGATTLNLVASNFTGAATVSHQGSASVAFDQVDHGTNLTVGAGTSVLPGTTLTSFNGSKHITVGSAAADVVAEAALAVTTASGGALELVGNTLTLPYATTVTTGNLKLDSSSALTLTHALSATDTVTLHTDNQDISGNGVITASTLAIDSGTGDATLGATQQVNALKANAGSLTLKNGKSLMVNGITVDKTVDLRLSGATSDLALVGAVTAHNTDSADTAILLAAGRNFVNNAGPSAVSADEGRWLVYSTSPLSDTRGGLAAEFKQYAAGLASTVLDDGSGFLYTVAPKIGVVLTGTADKVYDGNDTAGVDGIGLSLSGAIDGDTVVVDKGASAHYGDKNVGSDKTVTMTGLAIGSTGNAGVRVYGYALASTSASGDIGKVTPKTVSLGTGSIQDKVYDGSTSASLGSVTLDGVVDGDTVSFTSAGSIAFDDRNAGDGKLVNVGSVVLGGTDAGNYVVDGKAYADIDRRVLSVGVTVADKVYDGTTDASLSGQSLYNTVVGDDVSLHAGAAFTDKNVGTHKNVVVTASLDGDDAANYVLDATTADPRASTASVTPKTIDAGTLSVAAKVYDGNRDATVDSTGLVGVVAGDDLSLDLTGQYDDKNVGHGKQVDVSLGLSGGDAGNYQLSYANAISSGDITPKTINAGTLSVATKVYDGNRDATVGSTGLVGVVGGDDLSLVLGGQYDDKNAGIGKGVAVTLGLDGGDAGNYQLASTTATSSGDITRKTIDAGTLSVAAKVYDGNRDATVGSTGLVGVVTGDDLSLVLGGQYDNKNVGTGKQVDVSLGLSGDDAGNYQLVKNSATSHGDITPKTINAGTLSVATKVYDGNRDATVGSTGLVGVVTGDDLSLVLGGQYDDKNAGTGKRVDVTLGLDGGDAGNYRLSYTTANSTGAITPKTIGAGTLSVATKVYDGSRDAMVRSTGLVGVVAGDDLSLDLTGQYDDKNVGTGKRVDVSLGLGGADVGNYQLAGNSATSHGDITPKTIDAGTLSVAGKVYDGNRDATVNSTGPVGVVVGDDLSLVLGGQYDDKNAGIGKRVDVTLGLDGEDARNYRLIETSAQARGDVAAKELVVGPVGVMDKRFDGNRDAELVLPALRGVIKGDDVVLHGQGLFDTAGTAANKTVQIALSLDGEDAGNYVLVDARQQASAGIGDLPGRNAVDAVVQPPMGGNGTRPGTSDIGAGTSPGAVAAANGAMGDLTGAARPELGGGWSDPSAGTAGTAGSGGSGGSTGSAVAGQSAENGAGTATDGDARTASRDGAGAGAADFATEQMLRNGESVSIATGGETLVQPQESDMPVFTPQGQSLGRFRVDDLGDSLALHPVSGGPAAAPTLEQQVRVRATSRVKLDADEVASLRMELLEDGTLHITASANAAGLGPDALVAYGLTALKRQAGISPSQVRAVVLGFAG